MPNREDELLRKAVDEIEPAAGAKERMLENIKRKAALAANETESVQVEQEHAKETAEEKDTKKSFSRIIRLWIPAAAAVIILLLGVGIYYNHIKPQRIEDTGLTAGGERKDRKDLSTLKEDAVTEDEVRKITGEFPQVPKGATGVKYCRYSDIAAGMEFVFEGHRFRLTVMGTETAAEYFVPAESNEIRESWERDGNEYILVNSDNVDATLWDIVIECMKQ